mgnify:CR=1 FL=1
MPLILGDKSKSKFHINVLCILLICLITFVFVANTSCNKNLQNGEKIEKKLNELAPVGGTMSDFIKSAIAPTIPVSLQASALPAIERLVGTKPARIINKPQTTGLNSVDGLVDAGSSLLGIVVASNAVLQEYKTEVMETGDGEIDITKYKAKKDDYAAIMPILLQASIEATKAVSQIKDVQSDVKGLNPMKAIPTIKASKWAIDAVQTSSSKIVENIKWLKSIVNSIKAVEKL